jgi:polyhydroxybutyrate depolymerase
VSRRRDTTLCLLAVLLASCGRRTPEQQKIVPPPVPVAAAPSASAMPDAEPIVFGGNRPAWLVVPENQPKGKALPLVLMLHAYGATGLIEEWFFRFRPHAETRGFYYLVPEGTPNAEGKQYWNATDACCAPPAHLAQSDGGGQPPNDVEYLRELVGEVASKHDVDLKRVYVVGHSNGGFMAHRLACDHAELFAAMVSVAGATFNDESRCKPSAPVAALQIHGTADATISMQGGMFFGNKYPSARTTVDRWAALNGCDPSPINLDQRFDLDVRVGGAETRALRFDKCRGHAVVELWWMEGSGHVPLTTAELGTRIVDFLFAHPKP